MLFKWQKKEREFVIDKIKYFEKDLFRRIIDECVERATDFNFAKISTEIDYRDGIITVKLKRYIYDNDTTTIKTKAYTFRDLANLIVKKDVFIEQIKRDFVKENKYE